MTHFMKASSIKKNVLPYFVQDIRFLNLQK